MDTATPDRIAYSAREAARLLGVDRARIAAAIATGELPAYRLGRRRYAIRRDDLDAWLARHRVADPRRRAEQLAERVLARERRARPAA